MSIRFIHAADLHLDSPFKGLQHLPASIRDRIIHAAFHAFDRLIDMAIENEVDFVLFAGDIYDSAQRSLQAQLYFIKGLERLAQANIYTYIVHGNHDPLDGYIWDMHLPKQVHVFSGDEVQSVYYKKEGREAAVIYGISYPTNKVTDNLAQLFRREPGTAEIFSIGVLHTNCDAAKEHDNYAPCTKHDLLQAGLDYWALGHIHTRRILHEQPYIVYPGNLQGRHMKEQGEKGFYLVQVETKYDVMVSFQPVQDVIWLEAELDCSGIDHIDDVLQIVEEACYHLRQSYASHPLIIRLTGGGETVLAEELYKQEVQQTIIMEWNRKEETKDSFVWIESFRFAGSSMMDREELKAGEGPVADMLNQLEEGRLNPDVREELFAEALADLYTHPRAKQFLEEWKAEDQQEILHRVEALLLEKMIGGKKG